MTAQEIWDELVNLRFNSATIKLAQVKKWVSQAEIAVWNAADWEFKRVPLTNLTVANGDATEPADFGKVRRLRNALGDDLVYMNPDEFEDMYRTGPTIPTGVGEAYTVINRQILCGPKETATYQLSYRRRYTHLNTGGSAVQGVMSVSTDTPIWDSEFHYILVPWAMMLGEKLEDDPTSEMLRV